MSGANKAIPLYKLYLQFVKTSQGFENSVMKKVQVKIIHKNKLIGYNFFFETSLK